MHCSSRLVIDPLSCSYNAGKAGVTRIAIQQLLQQRRTAVSTQLTTPLITPVTTPAVTILHFSRCVLRYSRGAVL